MAIMKALNYLRRGVSEDPQFYHDYLPFLAAIDQDRLQRSTILRDAPTIPKRL